eukprot:CAMPEP_0185832678 /NCGR_PEP_ID=MMETSP1353-20130828/2223_1 /TAXON_ID=1077150 /ORGANISM="Erythrolobus australicus, Strain CCMP3124" /LENGTH=77 /DNA_ID=CAMNT_0028530881 /DNA_START=69 /DNA_END=302 /DNA_ORIENTATION=+
MRLGVSPRSLPRACDALSAARADLAGRIRSAQRKELLRGRVLNHVMHVGVDLQQILKVVLRPSFSGALQCCHGLVLF